MVTPASSAQTSPGTPPLSGHGAPRPVSPAPHAASSLEQAPPPNTPGIPVTAPRSWLEGMSDAFKALLANVLDWMRYGFHWLTCQWFSSVPPAVGRPPTPQVLETQAPEDVQAPLVQEEVRPPVSPAPKGTQSAVNTPPPQGSISPAPEGRRRSASLTPAPQGAVTTPMPRGSTLPQALRTAGEPSTPVTPTHVAPAGAGAGAGAREGTPMPGHEGVCRKHEDVCRQLVMSDAEPLPEEIRVHTSLFKLFMNQSVRLLSSDNWKRYMIYLQELPHAIWDTAVCTKYSMGGDEERKVSQGIRNILLFISPDSTPSDAMFQMCFTLQGMAALEDVEALAKQMKAQKDTYVNALVEKGGRKGMLVQLSFSQLEREYRAQECSGAPSTPEKATPQIIQGSPPPYSPPAAPNSAPPQYGTPRQAPLQVETEKPRLPPTPIPVSSPMVVVETEKPGASPRTATPVQQSTPQPPATPASPHTPSIRPVRQPGVPFASPDVSLLGAPRQVGVMNGHSRMERGASASPAGKSQPKVLLSAGERAKLTEQLLAHAETVLILLDTVAWYNTYLTGLKEGHWNEDARDNHQLHCHKEGEDYGEEAKKNDYLVAIRIILEVTLPNYCEAAKSKEMYQQYFELQTMDPKGLAQMAEDMTQMRGRYWERLKKKFPDDASFYDMGLSALKQRCEAEGV